jgi:large subunit ribosomal protein L21
MSITYYIMIAVIEIGGKQYTVENGSSLIVDRQQALVGSTIELGALLLANDKEVKVGTPLVE